MSKLKGEENSDGLEITSIGSLYEGSWNKKYWSSSRGKDRYPYPVGYQAVRAYNGTMYTMEIHEGLKGPLFVITSADGNSCSGETPDIVWESFQRKGCPRIWHGKRFSCKIDGIEFFGFKNPFVQRLLRELVSNINRTAERNLLSSSCYGTSRVEHDSRCPDACKNPDFVSDLAIPKITAKSTRRRKILNKNSISEAGLKRARPQNIMYAAEASNLIQGNQRIHSHDCSISLSTSKDDDNCTNADFLSDLAIPKITGKRSCRPKILNKNLISEAGRKRTRPQNITDNAKSSKLIQGIQSSHSHESSISLSTSKEDYDICIYPGELPMKKTAPAQEESKFVGSEISKSAKVAINLCVQENEKSIDRSQNTGLEVFDFPNKTDDKNGDATVAKDSPGINGIDLCVPDTLDFMLDNDCDSAPSIRDIIADSVTNVKDESPAADMVISEGLVTEPHPEEEIGTCFNTNSEKSDFDSGQEIAKSMMTVLLPQAIPLLKKASKHKKPTVSFAETLPSTVTHQEENNKHVCIVDIPSPVKFEALMYINDGPREKEDTIQSTEQCSAVPSSECIKSVVLDSFEDGQCGDHVVNLVKMSSEVDEDKKKCPPKTPRELFTTDSHVEITRTKDIFGYDEVHRSLDEKPQKALTSESLLGSTSPSKKVFPEVIKDVSANLGENSVSIPINSGEEYLETVPDCIEDTYIANTRGMVASIQIAQKDLNDETGVAQNHSSANQFPNIVYARKRGKSKAVTRKYNCPLSETIICRNSGDGCDPETNQTFLAPEGQTSSADELVGAEIRLGRQSHVLSTEDTRMIFKGVLNDMTPVLVQNQELICAFKDVDTSKILNPSVSHVEKFEAHVCNELVGHEILGELKNSALSQEKGTSVSDNKTSGAKEVGTSSDLKVNRKVGLSNDAEDNFQLLGSYCHPMPISSILLRIKENVICICVLCGLPLNENRSLFIYKVAIEEPNPGCPSFVGHTSVMLPISKDRFDREISLERSGFQFTPDGRYLVILDNIKTPYCREGKIGCLCSRCKENCFEESTVKIVQVESGYVSVVLKLKTVDSIQCILVCEPNHLIAAGLSGRLNVWVMNSTWSAHTEQFVISTNDCISPCILELKKIPERALLVVGHNGSGEFSLWDISRQILMSRFSAPSTSIYQILPIGLMSLQSKGHVASYSNVKEHIDEIVAGTRMWFSDHNKNLSFFPLDGEDVAIWVIVSAVSDSDSDAQDNCISSESQMPLGWWRLALLVKNTAVLGSPFDPRAAVIGASTGHGIIGTQDGLVYIWELAKGSKLGTLHDFKGGSVTCIVTDDSKSGVLAVAGDGGQMMLYLHTRRSDAN